MTTEYRGPELVRDDDLTRELRSIYAAPSDASWWAAFEQRINARIDAAVIADEWWTVPERWMRVGLIAAGFAVIVAGAMVVRSQMQVSRMAYQTVVDPASIDLLEVARGNKMTEQQARLRILTGR
ncbi:MAG: hypothetical protein ACREN6_05315 [Gemmatimonadaceae bacterium]